MTGTDFHRSRHGYVLLLTLVLLAMVAAGLAGVARRSSHATLEANRKEQHLQRKWFTLSAEQLLAEADTILSGETSIPSTARRQIAIDFDLGSQRITLLLADEQAKANLNALWERSDPAVVRAKVQELVASMGSSESIALRPLGEFEAVAAGSEYAWPVFGTYEQVLSAEAVRRQLADEPGESGVPGVGVFDGLTLWGDGRLRLERADSVAVHAVLFPLLSPSQIEQLITAAQTPEVVGANDGTFTDTASFFFDTQGKSSGGLELTDRQRAGLEQRVTSESTCFSLRLRFDDGRRVRSTLVVLDQGADDAGSHATRSFTW